MGGRPNTSTHDVTTKAPLSPSSKSKTRGTASEAIPKLSGHLLLHLTLENLLVIVVRCCSTCLAKGTSQTKEQARRYGGAAFGGLVLMEAVVT